MAKLVNNLVFTALVTVGLETFAFADELGMDRNALAQVLAHGSGGSQAAAILARSGFNTAGLRQAVANLDKDVRIALRCRSRHARLRARPCRRTRDTHIGDPDRRRRCAGLLKARRGSPSLQPAPVEGGVGRTPFPPRPLSSIRYPTEFLDDR